jgi:hypothetical protein
VGHVRRRYLEDPAGDRGAAEVEDLAVGHRVRWPQALVVEGQQAAERPVRDLRVRGGAEELVHRAAFVCLQVSERDPAQPRQRHHPLDRLAYGGEQGPHPGVVQQRLVGVDEELVEGEPARCDLRDAGGDPVDAVADLVSLCLHAVPSLGMRMWRAPGSSGRTWTPAQAAPR